MFNFIQNQTDYYRTKRKQIETTLITVEFLRQQERLTIIQLLSETGSMRIIIAAAQIITVLTEINLRLRNKTISGSNEAVGYIEPIGHKPFKNEFTYYGRRHKNKN